MHRWGRLRQKKTASLETKGPTAQYAKGLAFPAGPRTPCPSTPGGPAHLQVVRASVPFANSMLRVGQDARFGNRSQSQNGSGSSLLSLQSRASSVRSSPPPPASWGGEVIISQGTNPTLHLSRNLRSENHSVLMSLCPSIAISACLPVCLSVPHTPALICVFLCLCLCLSSSLPSRGGWGPKSSQDSQFKVKSTRLFLLFPAAS